MQRRSSPCKGERSSPRLNFAIPPLTQTVEELVSEFRSATILKAVNDAGIIDSVRGRLKNGICRIGRLMVHPAFQGQGIGSRLMQAMENSFSDARAWEIFTGERSRENIRLYERFGYAIVNKEPPRLRFQPCRHAEDALKHLVFTLLHVPFPNSNLPSVALDYRFHIG